MSARVLVFALCAIAGLVAHAAILASVIARRTDAVSAAVPRPRRAVEVLWAVLPLLALVALLAATWPAVRRASADETMPPMHHHAMTTAQR